METLIPNVTQRIDMTGIVVHKVVGIQLVGNAEPPVPCKVKMPCGEEFDYPTLGSFPKKTLPCPCGTGYVVRYA